MNRIYFFGLFFLILCSCKKEDKEITTRDKIIGTWRFKEKPAILTNPWMGHIENRTVFSGDEKLTFSKNGNFDIDETKYGLWELDSLENIIIDMSSQRCYAVGDFCMTQLKFEIEIINDTILKVAHNFYRIYDNTYVFEPLK